MLNEKYVSLRRKKNNNFFAVDSGKCDDKEVDFIIDFMVFRQQIVYWHEEEK